MYSSGAGAFITTGVFSSRKPLAEKKALIVEISPARIARRGLTASSRLIISGFIDTLDIISCSSVDLDDIALIDEQRHL